LQFTYSYPVCAIPLTASILSNYWQTASALGAKGQASSRG